MSAFITEGEQQMAGSGQGNTPPFNDPTNPGWYTDPYAKKPEQPAQPAPPSNPVIPPGPGYGPQGVPGYQQPFYGYGQQAKKGLSIAALVCGIVSVVTIGLFFIPQVLAIVFGHLALRREPAGKPLALTGLIMGYVVAGIWAVMLFFISLGAVFGS
ncbi:DUF4190 domain-containing protein [Arthrobacter sp. GCM10027362]|uniref:DUF4190 domain-containing protein n=1 Tax=Arthrobacter sp. GCM10027362 TaxID=3273379 RepID=UPI00363365D6